MSFEKENEKYLQSRGYSGTKWTSPRDKGRVEENQWLYDSIIKAAGDDGQLTNKEYLTIYDDRGPRGKYSYHQDSLADALARAAVDTGFKVDKKTLDRNDLTYDGDDILSKVQGGDYGPNVKDRDKYTYERFIEDEDEIWNVFRYKANKADPVEEEVVNKPEVPQPDCPSGQVRGTSGACIDDKDYAENPWEEPRKTPKVLDDLRNKLDSYTGIGSIDYLTPDMSDQYKPRIGSGQFSSFLRANQYQQDRSN
tara:strand:+ start:2345 stop:3100 length:756 start_codon:yes stop_codon:yes gene_type:complete